MGKVIMSGIVPQLTKPSAGTPISAFAVGSTVKMNVNGTATDFLIVHQGLPSSMYDESCNGTWLLMKDLYEERVWNSSNSNSYQTSSINTYLNTTFLGLFGSIEQSMIKQVKIPYVNGTGSSGSVSSGSSGVSVKIFLLSGIESGWGDSGFSYLPNDGYRLSYFDNKFTDESIGRRIGYLNGTAKDWWLRSPYTDSNRICLMTAAGNLGYTYYYIECGIRPALILPSTTLIDKNGNVKEVA